MTLPQLLPDRVKMDAPAVAVADGTTGNTGQAPASVTNSSDSEPEKEYVSAVAVADDTTGNIELAPASVANSSSDSEPAQEEEATATPKRRRLLKEIGDYNKEGAASLPASAASASPEASTRRSSPRARATTARLLDPTDGSEVDANGRRRKKDQHAVILPTVRVVRKGDRLCKKFGDEYFWGKVKSDVPDVTDGEVIWTVRYEDGDEEELNKKEILGLVEFEQARKALCYKMGVLPEEVLAALEQMERPYGLNEAMRLIHKSKTNEEEEEDEEYQEEFCRFDAKIGLKIRKNFAGASYNGTVTAGPEWKHADDGTNIKVWTVQFEDDDMDDMEYHELFRWRANRPNRPHSSGGRQFCALELFSGLGIVAQAFEDKRFRVQSIDSDQSNATMKMNIMELQYDDIGMVPDFIWASPPCETYSTLAGKKHRDPNEGKYEKTEEARLHNEFLLQLMCIIEWAKRKNPHLIVVIENPEAKLRQMPLMKELCDRVGLKKTTVHYCAFGVDEKKPTNLWSNDFNLLSRLNEYKCCDAKCPYYRLGNAHPRGARGNGSHYNTAAIPEGLAELVARHVDSKLFQDRINETKQYEVTDEDREELNRRLRGKKPREEDK